MFNVAKIDVIECLRTINKSKLERCDSENTTLLIITKSTFLMNKLLRVSNGETTYRGGVRQDDWYPSGIQRYRLYEKGG